IVQIGFGRAVYSCKIIYDVIAAKARTDLVIIDPFRDEAWFAAIFALRIVKVVIQLNNHLYSAGFEISRSCHIVVIQQLILMLLAFGDLMQQITLQIIQIKMSPSIPL